jgi:hypothetical protein
MRDVYCRARSQLRVTLAIRIRWGSPTGIWATSALLL